MNVSMRQEIDLFFKYLNKAFGYKVSDLSLVAELRGHGSPTSGPSKTTGDSLIKTSVWNGVESLPTASYDSLGSHHIQYTIMLAPSSDSLSGKPRPLYTWQHHVMPGNCGICVNRWVRVEDELMPWLPKHRKRALKLRAIMARRYSYGIMVITSGDSFTGAEVPKEFKSVYSGMARSPTTIRVLNLREFLKEDVA